MHVPHELTPSEYLSREQEQQGLCFSCGTWSGGTDPGAARARCGACGTPTLHGVEQALLLGAVLIRR
jgi:hypothetical protein